MSILTQEQVGSYELTYADLYSGFLDVANRLGEYYVNDDFSKMLPYFKKYNNNLAKELRRINKSILIKTLSGDKDVISLAHPHVLLKNKIIHAYLASICSVFNNWQVFLRNDIEVISKSYVKYNLSKLENSNQARLSTEYSKLFLMDASFNIHLLKQLGLLPVSIRDIDLISFGAAYGNKELNATQVEPCVETSAGIDQQLLVRFSSDVNKPNHSILIDSDPFWGEYYKDVNSKQGEKVLAINNDLYDALSNLPGILREKALNLRKLVTIWQLEKEVFPDVSGFFSGLSEVIENDCAFIVTIGAGDTDEEFVQRQSKLVEIYTYLKGRGMSPLRFIMHKGNRLEPLFGQPRYASLEMLYCNLNPELLQN